MLKRLVIFLIIVSAMVTFAACGEKTENENVKNFTPGKVPVVVSFNAMREFAQAVGGDKVDIKTIIPDGTEPHDYEPKASDLVVLTNAKVFVYNGQGMESWVDNALRAINNKNLTVVEASDGIVAIKNTGEELIKDEGQYDPHFWLSLKCAEIETKNVKDALVKVDPANKSYYEKNYNDFYNKLEVLFNDYKEKFNAAANKSFVTGHASFAYFCRDFGLIQNSVEDVFAEGEPSPKKLIELVDYCKQHKIKTIFVEDMVSPKVSETLANEVSANVKKIYTLESKEDGLDYLQSMKANIEMIYESVR